MLNVLGEDTAHSWYIPDCLDAGGNQREFYKDRDLMIGAQVNVFGRKVILTDVDPFTREYYRYDGKPKSRCVEDWILDVIYRTKYGIDDFTPLDKPDATKNSECKSIERYIPPYNGYGSYEDSLGNCFSMVPKPPKIDFVKFLHHDKSVSLSELNIIRDLEISVDFLSGMVSRATSFASERSWYRTCRRMQTGIL